VAAASPLVRGQDQQLICSAAGQLQFVTVGDDGGIVRAGAALQDCPLCILAGAPPQQLHLGAVAPACAAATQPAPRSVPQSTRSAPPLPPRGPPFAA
jgi:hypothetical protein